MTTIVRKLVMFTVIGLVSSEMKVVDLTHPLESASIHWPSFRPYKMNIVYRSQQAGGFWLEANSINMGEHTGTHLDAPAHVYKGGKRMAQIPIDRLVGPAVVVDVEESVKENPDYEVTVDDLKKWESKYGRIPDKAIIFMNSGWSKKYPDKTAVFGSENHNDTSTFHFPGLGLQAMKWLVANRNISLVGVDTPSFDYGATPGPSYPVHVFLLKNDIPGLENVANVHALPHKGATVTVGALKIKDGSGAPVRLIGVYDDNPNSGSRMYFSLTVLMSALILHI